VTVLAVSAGSGAAIRAEAAQLRLDPRFGGGGVARVSFGLGASGQFSGALVARQPGGKPLVVGAIEPGEYEPVPAVVARFTRRGRLDRSFGHNGTVRIAFPGPVSRVVSPPQPDTHFAPAAIVVQRDGRILLGGLVKTPCLRMSCAFTPRRFAIVRLLPDGRVDRSFGKGGFVERTPEKISGDDLYGPFALFGALIVQPDGGLLVAGSATGNYYSAAARPLLTRFHSDGSLDESFGDGGELRVPIDRDFIRWAPGPNGKLLGTGARNEGFGPDGLRYGLDVFRLNADGSPDPGFAGGGLASLPGPDGFYLRVLAGWPSGAVLIAGGRDVSLLRPTIELHRLYANGQHDASFHEGCAHREPARVGLLGATPFGGGALVTVTRPGLAVSRVLRYDVNGCLDPSFPLIRLAGQLTTPTVDGRGRPLIAGFVNRTLVLMRITRR
jgi:uncharacterized delta-60 repeat protein